MHMKNENGDMRLSFCPYASTNGVWVYCDREGRRCEDAACLDKASEEYNRRKAAASEERVTRMPVFSTEQQRQAHERSVKAYREQSYWAQFGMLGWYRKRSEKPLSYRELKFE